LNSCGEMTSMVQIHIEDGSPVLRFWMLLGAPEWMGFLVRCAGPVGFLEPDVSNSNQQHSIWMQELEVG
jgi:hypothetical protein